MKQFSGGSLMIKYILPVVVNRVFTDLGFYWTGALCHLKFFYVHNLLIMSIKTLNLFL